MPILRLPDRVQRLTEICRNKWKRAERIVRRLECPKPCRAGECHEEAYFYAMIREEMDQTEQTFEGMDYRERPLPKGEYEDCTFRNCDLSGTDLAGQRFFACTFTGCNLSLALLHKTSFQDCTFRDCKMLGLRFDHCSDFGLSFSFEGCALRHSSFYGKKIKKTVFRNSGLQETEFTDADLSGSVFAGCDLTGAKFEGTNLEKSDFRTSLNFSIDPQLNRVKKAKFSLSEVAGLLDRYDIVIDKRS